VIIAFHAARDIEQLRCQDFDSNLLYYEEMVSLYDQLVLEQGTHVMTETRLHLLIITGLASISNNHNFVTVHLLTKLENSTLTLTSLQNHITINELQSSHDQQNYVSNHANQVQM
jgi:hypothetical protein